MGIEIIQADQVSLIDQAALFTNAFTGYVGGSFDMDAAALARFLCAQGADLCHSRFARNTNGLCGFAYLGRTGSVSRVCGMGVISPARRSGVARQLLHHLIADAKERDDEAILLEVITTNPAAHALYKQTGFLEIAHLSGWRRPSSSGRTIDSPPHALTISEISLTAACQAPSSLDFPAIPWPISRHAAAKFHAGRAFSHDNATLILGSPSTPGPIRIHSLSTSRSSGKWETLRRTARALLDSFPDREFFAPPVFPDEFGREIFAPLNFSKEPIAQFHMRLEMKADG